MFRFKYREEDFAYICSLPDGWVDFYRFDAEDLIKRGDFGNIDDYALGDTKHLVDAKRKGKKLYREAGISSSVFDSDCPLRAPTVVQLELTLECNMGCKHCFNHGGVPRTEMMTTDEFKDIIYQLKEMEIFSLFFTGGEPTLHPDFLELVTYTDSLDMDLFVLTNGVNVTESLIKKVPRRAYFVFSLDGIDYHSESRKKITFEDLCTIFELLRTYDVPFLTQYVLQRNNIKDIINTYKWCEENRIDFAAIDLYPTGRAMANPDIFPTPEQLPLFRKLALAKFKYEKKLPEWEKEDKRTDLPNPYLFTFISRLEEIFERSFSGVFFSYIASDGTVYPDNWHAGQDMFPAGNVKGMPFKKIWETSFGEIRKLVQWSLYEQCKTCPVSAYFCDYRLPVLSYNMSGEYTSCGATDVMKQVMLLRAEMRETLENAYSIDEARALDIW